ncbi:alpha-amylase family glycosyl hydrolase [Teichococcus vastitatis]|jgi:alpha-glucosidase|uniref:Alpha-amylase family glycosyl hydrolase n=1 Tax=Teichococcus vastitatis TaxID=2307076 RepID=A0ABS9VZ20_9PROT|nr:alpha-amylase family glycosyl hydrolase [Pseudoroseomonas vastitatis]MCI0752224.1 alpha-amylase family glycosyl hydrolase [Pseudoroseomonas vastitatis]
MDDLLWWQRGVIYQVYPRSFQDSDGDGVGDLAGIAQRLDHLVSLGVDALWLSPIQPSPMADFGYDVADYRDVDPIFGSLAEFDALVAEAHRRGLRVILDFVPNHSSDQHPWFLDSRSGRNSAKRDWYIWRDPAPGGGPPTNWLSHFGGSAWEWDAASGQYYLHSFLKQQPDLNWRNPAVRGAMEDVLRFWLDRGVDGFRIDVIWLLIKDDKFRDNPANPDWREGGNPRDRLLDLYGGDRPEVHEVIAGLRRVIDAYDDRLMIGEIYLPVQRLVAYYGEGGGGAHLPFNFQLITAPWNAGTLAGIIRDYEAALPPGGWPNWVLGNHDQPRIASRVGPAQARVAAVLLLTLRGTPTLYYGDEIGMLDVPVPPDRVRDPAERNQPGLGLGRDPQRSPMLWDTTRNAGFSSGEPWLPLGATPSVAEREAEPDSILQLYRRLIALRRADPVLRGGAIDGVAAEGSVLRFRRSLGEQQRWVVLNLGQEPAGVTLPAAALVFSTLPGRATGPVGGRFELRGHEAVILRGDA